MAGWRPEAVTRKTATTLDESGLAALRRAIRLEYFTVGWMTVEAVVALASGAIASSIALVGFGLDSVMETVSGLALLWRLKQRRLEEHDAESRAVKVVGATFFALAGFVGYDAIRDLLLRRAPGFSLAGMILAVVSLGVMPVLGVAKRRVARALNSKALAADSLETFACAYLSAALLMGLALNGWLGSWWADPVAALAMCAFMIREGVEILRADRSESARR